MTAATLPSRPAASPLVTSPPMRPRTNPLRVMMANEVLRPGEKVACVLGNAGRSARGKRVVHGTVVGAAVRQMGRALDVELEDVSTWVHDTAPVDLEVLEPSFHPVFRIAVVGGVEATVALLRGSPVDGRSSVAAAEIPFRSCWRCGQVAGTRDGFCGNCSRRLRVGVPGGRADVQKPGSCPACWAAEPGNGRACVACGTPRALSARLGAQIGRLMEMNLIGGHRRIIRMEARLAGLRRERLSRHGGAVWVGTIDSVKPSGEIGTMDALSRFSVQIMTDVSDRAPQDILADLLEHGDVRVAEVVAPCPSCRVARGDGGPKVWTPWCPDCGSRVRLSVHSAWRERTPAAKAAMHGCGEPAWGGFCGFCGESASSTEGRFSDLAPGDPAPLPQTEGTKGRPADSRPAGHEAVEIDPRFAELARPT